jgi:hypothetical protein
MGSRLYPVLYKVNLSEMCGYVCGGTAATCFFSVFWVLTELEDCSSHEAIILYRRRKIAIKFKSTMIDDKDKGKHGYS